jgi:AraC-like DNA-binding protein
MNVNPASIKAPVAPRSHWTIAPLSRPTPRPVPVRLPELPPPPPATVVLTTSERMLVARDRIRTAAEAGQRIRSYEVALDLDMSEFHFARQFRAAFGRSPHVYYDECRAERARVLLRTGMGESDVARKVGFRRPAELRALLEKRA